jgi:hypothetical protein
MHKYSFTFLLVVLITLTSKSQNLDLIKSSLNHFQKEFHHKFINSIKWNPANLRIAQNSGKRLDSLVQEKWNVDLLDWEYSATWYFYYDQNGKPSHILVGYIDESNTYVESLIADFVFDEIKNMVTVITKEKLRNSIKEETIYDQNGRLKELIAYLWSDEALQYIEFMRCEYIYNSKGQLEREVSYDSDGDGWHVDRVYEYIYDENDNLLKKNSLHENYNGEFHVGSYIDYVKINSQLSEEQDYWRNDPNDTWQQRSIKKKYFDAKGNLVNDSTFFYYTLINSTMYEYDLSVDVSEVNLFSDILWDPLQLENMFNLPTVIIGGGESSYGISPYSKDSFYFSEQLITNTENLVSKTFTIYPNPTQSVLNIDGLEDNQPVTILNIDGTQVSTLRIQNGKISTQGLMPGMYILDLGDQKLKFGVTK